MKNYLKVINIILILLHFSIVLTGQNANWKMIDKIYVKTSQELSLSHAKISKLNKYAYIVDKTELTKIPSKNMLYESPLWKHSTTGDLCAIDNSIILYDVYDLTSLISENNLTSNIISIDSIIGKPTIYIASLRNITYSQIDSLCSLLTCSYCKFAESNHVLLSDSYGDISPNPANNTYYYDQWGLNNSSSPNFDINSPNAWHVSTGENIKVAVIDVGFELNHPDLVGNIYSSYDCTDGGDGAINGAYVLNNDSHGTQCAGVIGATNNNIGVIGVAPDSELLLLRRGYTVYITPDSTKLMAQTAWHIQALRYAYQNGADVISNSWSMNDPISNNHNIFDAVLQEAFTSGRNGKGSVIVFSAGNQARNFINYPSNSPYTISAGAMTQIGHRPTFSNYGQDLDVVAPGVNIKTTQIIPYGSYCFSSGTSFAAPMVAGVAALVLSVNSNLTSSEVGNLIRSSTYKLPNYAFDTTKACGSWNPEVGYGLVDAYAAVIAAVGGMIQGPDYICLGDTVSFSLLDIPEDAVSYTWSATAPFAQPGQMSIVQGQGTSSAQITLQSHAYPWGPKSGLFPGITPVIPPHNFNGSVSVTITMSDGTTYTATKALHSPKGRTPVIEASSTETPWKTGTTRHFTITNNTSAPWDSLHWEIMDVVYKPTGNDTTIIRENGNTIYYTPFVPPTYIGMVTITATNTFETCGNEQIASLEFETYNPLLHSYINNNEQPDTISLVDRKIQQSSSTSSGEDYILEIWHTIYGLMRVQPAASIDGPIDTSGIPQGTYILLLKKEGNVIAQSKVII